MAQVRTGWRRELAAFGTVQVLLLAGGFTTAGVAVSQKDDLLATIDSLFANTARDLAVGSIDVVDASGAIEQRQLLTLSLLVQPGGASAGVELNGTLGRLAGGDWLVRFALAEDEATRALRDRDGSMARLLMNENDLVEVEISLPRPVALLSGAILTLTLYPEGKAPVEHALQAPSVLTGKSIVFRVQTRYG